MNAAARTLTVASLLALTALSAVASPDPTPEAKAEKPDRTASALRMLQEGNQRFVDGKSIHPNTDVFRVADTGEHGQHPFAVVVGCADSRAAVERVFDRGVGDLFVVRTAGNIVDASQTGSVEYACEHLGAQLVIALGHTKCGAVTAATKGVDGGKNINAFLDNITPCVKNVKTAHPELTGDQLVDAVVRENAFETIEDMLKGSPMLRGMVQKGEAKMIAAVYDVETGKVEWLGQHPALAGLLKEGEPESTTAAKTDTPAAGEKPDAHEPAAPAPAPKPVAVKPAPTKTPAAPKKEEGGHDAPAYATHPH